jgi:WD40 repeat protein
MARDKNKKLATWSERVHPHLRQQGLIHRAGYGGIRSLFWDSRGLWVASRGGMTLWDPAGDDGPALLSRLWTPLQCCCPDGQGGWFTARFEVDRWGPEFDHRLSFAPHTGTIRQLTASPDGQFVVTLGEDESVCISTGEGEKVRQFAAPPEADQLQVDWVTRRIQVGREVIDLSTGLKLGQAPEASFEAPPAALLEVLEEEWVAWVAHPQGEGWALASEHELVVVDVDGEVVAQWDDFLEWPVTVTASPDGRRLLSGGLDGRISVRDSDRLSRTRHWEAHHDAVTALSFEPKGRALFSGCADGTVAIWSWPERQPLHQLDGHDGPVTHLKPLEGRLLSAGEDGQVLIWDWSTGLLLASLSGFDAAVQQLEICSQGEVLLALYDDGSWASWDLTRYG